MIADGDALDRVAADGPLAGDLVAEGRVPLTWRDAAARSVEGHRSRTPRTP